MMEKTNGAVVTTKRAIVGTGAWALVGALIGCSGGTAGRPAITLNDAQVDDLVTL